MRLKSCALLVAVTLVFAMVACGSTQQSEDVSTTVVMESSVTSTSEDPTASTEDAGYDGSWVGETAAGNEISFTVEDGAVVRWSFNIDTTLEGGSSAYPFVGKGMFSQIEAEKAEFSMGGKTISWGFTSNTEASGTYTYDHPDHGLLTTEWTATRQ